MAELSCGNRQRDLPDVCQGHRGDERFVRDEDRERRTILVDDLAGTAHRAYGAMPNTVHVIDPAGTVVYRSTWADPQTIAALMQGLRDGRRLDELPGQQFVGAPSQRAQGRVQEARDRVLRRAGPQAARDMPRRCLTFSASRG